MKEVVDLLLRAAFEKAKKGGELRTSDLPPFVLEVPREAEHGDLASNLALALARSERRSPREVAECLLRHFDGGDDVQDAWIAGPGFLNFRFRREFWHARLAEARQQGEDYGFLPALRTETVQVEFVSANPTGPLTVGHGRNAVLGDTIARLLEARGHTVTREYYFNNAGRQMKVLAESVRARYLERIGREGAFPEDGYQGEYIREIAEALEREQGASLADGDLRPFQEAAEKTIFGEILRSLESMRIGFDVFFNEDSLYADGSIERTLADLRARGHVYERDGAVWLGLERLGLPADKVLIKSSGEPAYRMPDIAYHRNKLERGFDLVIDVLGADHIAESEEVRAALRALGLEAERVQPIIYQFVTLVRGGKPVKMSTRRAEYVTLDELVSEVGVDVVRFLFLTRKSDSHLEFDLDLAKSQSMENPVYYVQYAHARIANIRKKAAAVGLEEAPLLGGQLERLVQDDEMRLVRRVVGFPDVIAAAADGLEPHRLTFYLLELAAEFHSYYNRPENRVVSEDVDLSRARLALVESVGQVIRRGLGLLGVGAPDQM
ncbi:MAG: arginyl-tRNA synthetase [Candidatus Binatota bacterium]|nr:arginyl-tRNA synthetase [Candidatus Binatota bacterium]